MSVVDKLSEYVTKSSNLQHFGPSFDVFEGYPFDNIEVDTFIDKLIENKNKLGDKDIDNLYHLYTNLRESRFLDNYLYLFFEHSPVLLNIESLSNLFGDTLESMVGLYLKEFNERIDFLTNMKKRVARVRFIRDILEKKYPDVKIRDDMRYVNVVELEKEMIIEIDLEEESVRDPTLFESEPFFKGDMGDVSTEMTRSMKLLDWPLPEWLK